MHEQCPALSLSRARLGLAGRGLRNPSAGRGLAQGPWLGGPPPLLREPLSRGPGLPRRIRLHRPSRRPQRATGARGQGRGAIGGGLRACTLGALGLQPPWRPHPDFSETLWIEGNVNKTSNPHIACLHQKKSYRIHSTPGSCDFCLIYSQSQSTGRPRKYCKFGSQPLKDSQYHN